MARARFPSLRSKRDFMEATRVVQRVGTLAPNLDPQQAWHVLAGTASETVADVLQREKVCRRVVEQLSAVAPADASELRAAAQSQLEWTAAVADGFERVVPVLERLADELQIPVWLIKGAAARRWYDRPELRDVSDIDIMVPDIRSAFALAQKLRRHGFSYEPQEIPWFKRDIVSGALYGQINLRFPADVGPPSVDIHFAGYSVRHCGFLPLPTGLSSEGGLSYFTHEQNLPLLIGNAAGDHRITTKDVNDLLITLGQRDLHWEHILDVLETAQLLGFFRCMLDRLVATAIPSPDVTEVVRDLLRRSRPEAPRPLPSFEDARRWAATTAHAWHIGRGESVARGVAWTVSAARYYAGALRPHLGRSSRPFRIRSLDPATCVRLLPRAELEALRCAGPVSRDSPSVSRISGPGLEIGETLQVLPTESGDLVRVGDEVFVPTVWYRIDPNILDAYFAIIDGPH